MAQKPRCRDLAPADDGRQPRRGRRAGEGARAACDGGDGVAGGLKFSRSDAAPTPADGAARSARAPQAANPPWAARGWARSMARVSVFHPPLKSGRKASGNRRSRRAPCLRLAAALARTAARAHGGAGLRREAARVARRGLVAAIRNDTRATAHTPTHPPCPQRRPARDATHRCPPAADRTGAQPAAPRDRAAEHHRRARPTLRGADGQPRRLTTRACVRRLGHPQTLGCGAHATMAIGRAAGAARCAPPQSADSASSPSTCPTPTARRFTAATPRPSRRGARSKARCRPAQCSRSTARVGVETAQRQAWAAFPAQPRQRRTASRPWGGGAPRPRRLARPAARRHARRGQRPGQPPTLVGGHALGCAAASASASAAMGDAVVSGPPKGSVRRSCTSVALGGACKPALGSAPWLRWLTPTTSTPRAVAAAARSIATVATSLAAEAATRRRSQGSLGQRCPASPGHPAVRCSRVSTATRGSAVPFERRGGVVHGAGSGGGGGDHGGAARTEATFLHSDRGRGDDRAARALAWLSATRCAPVSRRPVRRSCSFMAERVITTHKRCHFSASAQRNQRWAHAQSASSPTPTYPRRAGPWPAGWGVDVDNGRRK